MKSLNQTLSAAQGQQLDQLTQVLDKSGKSGNAWERAGTLMGIMDNTAGMPLFTNNKDERHALQVTLCKVLTGYDTSNRTPDQLMQDVAAMQSGDKAARRASTACSPPPSSGRRSAITLYEGLKKELGTLNAHKTVSRPFPTTRT
ncbi:MAG: hypothetical protein WDN72_08905 [Alphaproteobacteria bacterium]